MIWDASSVFAVISAMFLHDHEGKSPVSWILVTRNREIYKRQSENSFIAIWDQIKPLHGSFSLNSLLAVLWKRKWCNVYWLIQFQGCRLVAWWSHHEQSDATFRSTYPVPPAAVYRLQPVWDEHAQCGCCQIQKIQLPQRYFFTNNKKVVQLVFWYCSGGQFWAFVFSFVVYASMCVRILSTPCQCVQGQFGNGGKGAMATKKGVGSCVSGLQFNTAWKSAQLESIARFVQWSQKIDKRMVTNCCFGLLKTESAEAKKTDSGSSAASATCPSSTLDLDESGVLNNTCSTQWWDPDNIPRYKIRSRCRATKLTTTRKGRKKN